MYVIFVLFLKIYDYFTCDQQCELEKKIFDSYENWQTLDSRPSHFLKSGIYWNTVYNLEVSILLNKSKYWNNDRKKWLEDQRQVCFE